MDLCQYKNIFGEPGQGLHSYRLFNVAIVDVMLMIFVSYLISSYFNLSFVKTTIILFILGIIFHRLFCVRTTLDKLLFKN